ncbi:hypothetical protein B0H14DRAFT_510942, partial [Mycena olivaceomarginata]
PRPTPTRATSPPPPPPPAPRRAWAARRASSTCATSRSTRRAPRARRARSRRSPPACARPRAARPAAATTTTRCRRPRRRSRPRCARGTTPRRGSCWGARPRWRLYLVMKAKHRYAAQQHERLLEELRVVRAQLKVEKDEKELMLDDLLRGCFGAQAEHLIQPVPLPPSMLNAVQPIPLTNNSTSNLNATHMANGNSYYRTRPEVG